jgi:hypothetical protein
VCGVHEEMEGWLCVRGGPHTVICMHATAHALLFVHGAGGKDLSCRGFWSIFAWSSRTPATV